VFLVVWEENAKAMLVARGRGRCSAVRFGGENGLELVNGLVVSLVLVEMLWGCMARRG